MFSWLGLTISHTITAAAAAAAENDDDADDDESYTGSNQSDISLGSNDTNIKEEEELAGSTMPSTPKKPASSAKKVASGKKQKDPVLELATKLAKQKLDSNCDFSFQCPKLMFTCRDRNRSACVFEMLSALPSDWLKHCKVLPGGNQLSILFGYPRVLASERCHRKLITQNGNVFDEHSARAMARSTQVTHFVESNHPDHPTMIDGDPQVLNLPFTCVEGEVPGANLCWVAWPTDKIVTYRNRDHKQFLNILCIKLESIHTFAVARERVHEAVIDDSEESSDSEGSQMSQQP